MPRKPRFYLPDVPVHVVQRGNDRQPVFFAEADYIAYLEWLRDGAEQHGCAVHSYVLMTNHVHLLMTPSDTAAIGRALQFLGRHYVPYVNRTYGRTGTLWEGRHKGSSIDSSRYALTCSRYIEMNPVRAGMVPDPGAYRWSSFRCNAYGLGDAWLAPMPEYEALGATAEERQHRYRELFRDALDVDQEQTIRRCIQTGTPLGDERFKAQIEAVLGRKVGRPIRGRPRKVVQERAE